jgi:alkaline phosphatase
VKARIRIAVGCVTVWSTLVVACAGDARQGREPETPDSIILLIADGAGVAHWTLAAFANEQLAVRRMKSVGLVDTRGADHVVSGSAPTATAYATGVRSFMSAIGVGPDSLPRETVLEAAIVSGMSTGLITTTVISDATPAAFAAHHASRYQWGDIARQMTSKGINVLLGGGRDVFGPRYQADSADILPDVRRSYTYVDNLEQLRSLNSDSVTMLLGLFAAGDMGIVADRGPDALQLMTSRALAILGRNPEGFFLMIENEESDTQSHANASAETVTAEMLDFDKAVALALEYQAAHPRTLVVVTSDHETGGISLTHRSGDPRREATLGYATTDHSGVLVPLFATGPGAARLGGIIRNDEVGQVLLRFVRKR